MSTIPKAQLNCEQCQRRKIKCNKEVPCSACSRSGIPCTAVQRHRLPRGRTGNQKTNRAVLQGRIERLETLLAQVHEPTPNGAQSSANKVPKEGASKTQIEAQSVSSFVAPEFWAELSDTVAGLKDVLELQDAPHGIEYETTNRETLDSNAPDNLLFGVESSASPSNGTHIISEDLKQRLLATYKERVDPIIKVLHWPTTLSRLDSLPHDDTPGARDLAALENAIYFAASCSLQDDRTCADYQLHSHFRRQTEAALVRANLLTSTSLILLQAFVIYLAALRVCLANAQQWTLVATAVRLASAQGLQYSSSQSHLDPLEGELRRRLWFAIGFLDMQCAFDRGSKPLLDSKDFIDWPRNIDDAEFNPQALSFDENSDGKRFTEMSFSILAFKTGHCHRKLTEIGMALNPLSTPAERDAAFFQQMALLTEFEHHVQDLAFATGAAVPKFHDFVVAVGKECLTSMWLLLHRPFYKRSGPPGPAAQLAALNFDVMAVALETLERSMFKRSFEEFSQWAWCYWLKWYALAVLLAELCVTTSPLAERAWQVARLAYDDYAKVVADTKVGLLWKPVMKLMQKVSSIQGRFHSPNFDTSSFSSMSLASIPNPATLDPTAAPFEKMYTNVSQMQSKFAPSPDLLREINGSSNNKENYNALFYWESLVDDIYHDPLL